MSDFRRHDKIQLWLNRPVPWNAVSSHVQSPTITGDWMLGSTLIMDAALFICAPLHKPLVRCLSLIWLYQDEDANELQVKIDTDTGYPISVAGWNAVHMLIDRIQRVSQDTESIPSQWAVRIVDINPELSV